MNSSIQIHVYNVVSVSHSLIIKEMDFNYYDLYTLCRELMLGLSANVNQPAVHVDLSCNDMKSEGGLVLGGCVANLKNIHGLDLSDNGKCC